jgi:1,4-alpha-glucan branching enzyme
MSMLMPRKQLEQLLDARLADPFAVLGLHRQARGDGQVLVCRVFRPDVAQVVVLERDGAGSWPAVRVHPQGLFEAVLGDRGPFAYELEITTHTGQVSRVRDPYSFWPLLSGYDQYLLNEGSHLRAYDKLGAHVRTVDGCAGVYFAVWAPAARRVSVVGDFNQWDGRRHPMRSLGAAGVWEIFIPDLGEGALYKYELTTAQGELALKCDPYGFGTEVPPRTASVVRRLDTLEWGDAAWLEQRAAGDLLTRPVSIYEVHAGSWRWDASTGRPLSWRELAHQLVAYVRELGFTHIELMPVAEHPFGGSWGYQVTGFFAPTARFGAPADFAYLVDHCHRHGIGVIVDWVAGHFPRDAHGLARFDGTALYEHEDPRQGLHPDWDTLIFNYGRNEVRSFLLSNALFWLDTYHVDGLRVDAVASMLYLDYSRPEHEWVPNRWGGRENLEAIEFVQRLNAEVYGHHPGVMMIAEESTAWPAVSRPTWAGGLGFGYKWNMGWMHDVLRYLSNDPVHRKYHHSDLTFGMLYAYHENFILPLSHDEVVHGKRSLVGRMPGDQWQMLANLRLLLGYQYGHPGKKLLFMGGEFAQWNEWDCQRPLDWGLLAYATHQGIRSLVRDLNRLYGSHPALHATDYAPDGFRWIDCQDVDNGVICFLRRQAAADQLVFVLNLTPVVRRGYRVGVPRPGAYREVLNTDAQVYGGSNVGNAGEVPSRPQAWHGYADSVELVLPPLGMLVLEPAAG